MAGISSPALGSQTGTSATQVQGTAASGATDSGNPITTAGVYNSTAPTFTSGQRAVSQSDINGNTKIVEQYGPVYEDNTNGKAIVEHRYSYSVVATGDTQVKAGAGFLHTVTISCNDAAPTAGSLIIYDNTAESGNVVFNHTFTTTPFAPFTVLLDYTMTTGIYLGFTTTADVNVSVSYR